MASLTYPKFPKGDFTYVDRSLGIVDYYLNCRKAIDRYTAAERAYKDAVFQYENSDLAMYQRLLDSLTKLTTPPVVEGSKAVDKALITTTVMDRLKRLIRTGHVATEERKLLLEVLPLFCTFDSEGFTKACKARLDATKGLQEAKNSTAGKFGYATGEVSKAKGGFTKEGIFSDPEYVLSQPADNQKQFAFEAANRFVKVWEDRARRFALPVSITGVAIHTMPSELRTIWSKAYDALGFKSLRKTPVYHPITSDERTLTRV